MLDLEPFAATSGAVSPDAEVRSATAGEASLQLLGAGGEAIAEVVQPGTPPPPDPSFPRLVLKDGQTLIAAYATLTTALTERAQYVAERSRSILQSLTEAELQGRTLQEIVALLARLVGNPVILKDSVHRVLAWSGNPEDYDPVRRQTVEAGQMSDEVVEALEGRGILTRIRTERRPFRIEGDERNPLAPRVVCPVTTGDTQFGYLSISEGARRLDQLDFLAVESGATVVAVHLARQRAVEESVRSQRALLIYELLFLPQDTALPRRRRQAALMEFDIDQKFVILSIRFEKSDVHQSDPDRWSRLLHSIVSTVDATLDRLELSSTVAMAEDDGILVLLPSTVKDIDDVAEALLREITAYHRAPDMCAGVSLPRTGSEGLGDSYEEARLTAELGRILAGAGTVMRYERLGALRLLNEISEDLVERHLSVTLTDDQGFREQFLETFGALVEASYNKAAAARDLYIHVNTLKYRLGRIRKVTGHDVGDHHGRFALECTLRLLELQKARRENR